jgi:hypothetical protein
MGRYQPLDFVDFGREDSERLGFSYDRGGLELFNKKDELIRKLSEVSAPDARTLTEEVELDKSWGIFDILSPSRDEDVLDYHHRMTLLDRVFPDVLDFGINLALYTSINRGAPGYNKGHSIILAEAENPRSCLVNIISPDFQRRLVNGAFWENVGMNPPNLANILHNYSAVLDIRYLDAGLRILNKSLTPYRRNPNPAATFDLSNLSKRAVRNYAAFVTGVYNHLKDKQLPLHESVVLLHVLARPLFNQLVEIDEDSGAIYSEEERREITKGLEDIRTLFDVEL